MQLFRKVLVIVHHDEGGLELTAPMTSQDLSLGAVTVRADDIDSPQRGPWRALSGSRLSDPHRVGAVRIRMTHSSVLWPRLPAASRPSPRLRKLSSFPVPPILRTPCLPSWT